jgi:hypothetical protein
MMDRRYELLLLFAVVAGCVTRGTVQPGEILCEWPQHEARPLDLESAADRAHLRNDAIAAEDFAIGHADANMGRSTPGLVEGWDRRVDRCMNSVFTLISDRHDVDVGVVREYRLRRNRVADAAVIGSFGLIYLAVSYFVAGAITRRFGGERSRIMISAVVVSLALGWAGMVFGEVWSIFMEAARIGRGHLSYRAARIPWVQHRFFLFVIGVGAFLLIAAVRYRYFVPHEENQAGLIFSREDTRL